MLTCVSISQPWKDIAKLICRCRRRQHETVINLKTAKHRASIAACPRRRGDRVRLADVRLWHLSEIAAQTDDVSSLGLKQTLRCEHRDLILTRSECVRSSPWWGVVKSLAPIGAGPVGLVHTHRVGIKYKKPPRLAPTEFSQWLVHTVANVDGASAYEPIAIHEHQRSAAARTRLR